MKKIKLVMLGLCLVLGLTACGKEKKTYTPEELATLSDEEFEVALEAAIEQMDAMEAAKTEATITPIESNRTPVEPKQEILDATWDSGMIQFNDVIVELPIRLSKLVELGFEYEIYDKSKDYLFEKGEGSNVKLFFDGVEVSMEILKSDMDGFHTLEEIDPILTQLNIKNTFPTVDIYYAKGIHVGDSFTTIEEKLGTPYEIDGNRYIYGSSYSPYLGMWVYFDKETQKISSIMSIKDIDAYTFDTLTTITKESVGNSIEGGERFDITLTFAPALFEKENHGNLSEAIINHNNELYYMTCSYQFKDPYIFNGPNAASFYDPILDETNENGVRHLVYYSYYYENGYDVYTYVGDKILESHIVFKNISRNTKDSIFEVFDENVIAIAKSINYVPANQ